MPNARQILLNRRRKPAIPARSVIGRTGYGWLDSATGTFVPLFGAKAGYDNQTMVILGYDDNSGIGDPQNMNLLVKNTETWKGVGACWKQANDMDTTTSYGWPSAGTSAWARFGFGISGLHPTNPFGQAALAYWYTTTQFPSVDVPVNGGLMFIYWSSPSQIDPAITSMSPVNHLITSSATTAGPSTLGVFIADSVPPGPTGTITVLPAGEGGPSDDSWVALVALNRAA